MKKLLSFIATTLMSVSMFSNVATPVISGSTEFTDSTTVTITCSTDETKIFYTLDGSDPRLEGADEYTDSLTLKETTTIRAAAHDGEEWSTVAEKTFTFIDWTEILFDHNVSAVDLPNDAVFEYKGLKVAITDSEDKMSIDENKAYFGTEEVYEQYAFRLKTGGKSRNDIKKNYMTIIVPKAGELRIAVRTASSSDETRTLVLVQEGDTIYNQIVKDADAIEVAIDDSTKVKVYPFVTVPVKAGEIAVGYPVGAINFYEFGFGGHDVKSINYSYDSTKGSVIGASLACVNSTITFSAVPNYGYNFTQWSDGVKDNPRTIILTQDTTFTAEFAINEYTITTQSSNPEWGTTKGDTTALYLDEIQISATPKYGYHFTRWNDYYTSNPRTIQITEDKTFTAIFEKNIYFITKNATNGSISGYSQAEYLDEVTLTATPNYGYHFVQWSDGITDNSRTITLTQDTTFTAVFAADQSGKCGDNLVWALTDNALTIIGSGAMWDEQPWGASRESIKQVNLPQGLTYIGNYAFEGFTALTALTIPSSVESVGRQPFYGCSNITSFVGPVVAFNSLYSEIVQSLTLNGGVLNDYNHLAPLSEVLEKLDLSGADCSVLPKRALYDFYMLRELVLPANLETIGYMAVANCKNLQRITIPASVTDIAQSAFEDCRSLSDLTFAEGSQLETIDSWAFYNCHNLPKIEIPDGVTEIGDAAFYGCVYAENLKIPASVRSIGDNAFALCSKLNRMDVDAVVPPTIVAKTFYEVSRKAPVYVPDESVTLYKADPLWNELNIVGQHESPTAVETISNDQLPITNKILRDGQILILRGEKVYTVTGQEVK